MSATERLPDWERLLTAEIERVIGQPFSWNGGDCITFGGDVVRALTGEDIIADLRGKYDSEEDARRLMHELGHKDVAEAVASRLEEVPPAHAERGDLAIVRLGMDSTGPLVLGVVVGPHIAVRSEEGLALVRRSRAVRAFAVG